MHIYTNNLILACLVWQMVNDFVLHKKHQCLFIKAQHRETLRTTSKKRPLQITCLKKITTIGTLNQSVSITGQKRDSTNKQTLTTKLCTLHNNSPSKRKEMALRSTSKSLLRGVQLFRSSC